MLCAFISILNFPYLSIFLKCNSCSLLFHIDIVFHTSESVTAQITNAVGLYFFFSFSILFLNLNLNFPSFFYFCSYVILSTSESVTAQITNAVCRHRRLGGVTSPYFGFTSIFFHFSQLANFFLVFRSKQNYVEMVCVYLLLISSLIKGKLEVQPCATSLVWTALGSLKLKRIYVYTIYVLYMAPTNQAPFPLICRHGWWADHGPKCSSSASPICFFVVQLGKEVQYS